MRSGLVLLVAALALVAAGCGGEETVSPAPEDFQGTVTQQQPPPPAAGGGEGDAAAGKEVFASAGCGSCHTLADAGTSGTVGPNLDEVQPSFDQVVTIVTDGRGVMPSFKDELSAKQIRDVAAYVSSAAGG